MSYAAQRHIRSGLVAYGEGATVALASTDDGRRRLCSGGSALDRGFGGVTATVVALVDCERWVDSAL